MNKYLEKIASAPSAAEADEFRKNTNKAIGRGILEGAATSAGVGYLSHKLGTGKVGTGIMGFLGGAVGFGHGAGKSGINTHKKLTGREFNKGKEYPILNSYLAKKYPNGIKVKKNYEYSYEHDKYIKEDPDTQE